MRSDKKSPTREPISIGRIFMYIVLFIGALIMIFPFYWMITGAFKTWTEVNLIPPTLFPRHPTLDNFSDLMVTMGQSWVPFSRYLLNTVVITVLGSLLLSLMMVPYEMIIITNYRTIVSWNLHDTIWALILPFMSSIFYTYILKGFFDSVPESLYQAAKVDGCSDWKYLWRVMVPMAKSSLATIILLNAIATWNSFLWPMIATNSKNVRTLPFGLYAFMTEGGQRNERMMAASTIVVIPMIIIFLFARKYIISGMSRGGIKG